jgi:nitrogen fixation protein FixH
MAMKKGRFWEIGIWFVYGGFVTFILGCIAYVAFRRADLVEFDYYEKGLEYQRQIGKIQSGANERPQITYDKNRASVILTFSDSQKSNNISGSVLFFKPSDAEQDFEISLNPDSGKIQIINDKRLGKGFWRVKINWQIGEQKYYFEDQLYIE